MDRLAAMEVFVLVVDTGSFSAAARRLNVGQPAVSKLIAQLEERLGVKLLVRTTRGLTSTEAGLNYYERARRAIEEAEEAELAARGAATSLTGKLRIAAAVTFARIHLMPRLPEFLQRHPDLEIEVVLDDRNVDLVQEGIDVALRMGQLIDSSLTARRIASMPYVVVGTPTYFAGAGEPTAPGNLTGHEAVIFDRGGGGAEWTFQRDDAELAVTLSARSREAILIPAISIPPLVRRTRAPDHAKRPDQHALSGRLGMRRRTYPHMMSRSSYARAISATALESILSCI
jgi:DNA-binding transcriptional LysR family regulator